MAAIDRTDRLNYNGKKPEGGAFMDIHVGDVLKMKKNHPCGSG